MPSPSSSTAFALLSLLALTSAIPQDQASLPDLSKLPECAQKSATEGIAKTSCTLTDFTCICKSSQFVDAVGATISSSCSPADQQATLAFANAVCGPLGVTLPTAEISSAVAPPAPGPTSPSSAASAPEASSAAPPAATYAAPSAAEDNMAAAAAATGAAPMASMMPPYPVANNGSYSNMTNQTALPFEGAASQHQPIHFAAVAVTVLVAAAGFSFL